MRAHANTVVYSGWLACYWIDWRSEMRRMHSVVSGRPTRMHADILWDWLALMASLWFDKRRSCWYNASVAACLVRHVQLCL